MKLDRLHREMLIDAIDRYLHEELTAFQFDELIFDIHGKTDDETVKHVIDYLWLFYDDCDDHKVVLNRVSWNCIQRLRLLLKSDANLDFSEHHIWSRSQIVAAAALLAFTWLACASGIGSHLMIAAIPFGFVSIALSSWRRRLYRSAANWDETLHPFTSISQLLWVGHGVSEFRKEKYPSHLATRRIRRTFGLPTWAQYPFWLLYSPVILLVQLLPVKVPMRRVVAGHEQKP